MGMRNIWRENNSLSWEVCGMLISFKVKNFRSFQEEIEFSMEAAPDIEAHRQTHVRSIGEFKLLKSAVLFGPNASGKSNFVEALSSLVFLITKPTNDVTELLFTNTFAFSSDKNTSYQIEFIRNSKHFIYALEVNTNEVVFEQLLVNNAVCFERKRQEFVETPKTLQNQTGSIRKNQLLLFFAQAKNDSRAVDAYIWFNQDLIFADSEQRQISLIFELRSKLQNPIFKEKFLAILKYADFDITNIAVFDTPVPGSSARLSVWSHVITTHTDEAKNEFMTGMWEESEGTRKFVLVILEIMFNAMDDGKVIIFDEFDESLYQELAQILVYSINREKQNSQFILTTHELSLMNCDLRTDQIYFTEKNRNNGSTKLLSLYDFDDPELEKEYVNYEQRYLTGRYGVVPIIARYVIEGIFEEDDHVETK